MLAQVRHEPRTIETKIVTSQVTWFCECGVPGCTATVKISAELETELIANPEWRLVVDRHAEMGGVIVVTGEGWAVWGR